MTELTKAMEQYLETIYDLQQQWGAASVTDIAERRGVKSPSVTYVLQKLKKLNLVNYKKYRSVSLTSKGLRIAKRLERTHETLEWFLMLIGVDEKIANADACELEHFVHSDTMARLTEFAEWVKGAPKHPKWIKHFREFQKTGRRTEECAPVD